MATKPDSKFKISQLGETGEDRVDIEEGCRYTSIEVKIVDVNSSDAVLFEENIERGSVLSLHTVWLRLMIISCPSDLIVNQWFDVKRLLHLEVEGMTPSMGTKAKLEN